MENQGPANEACANEAIFSILNPKPSSKCVKYEDFSFFQGLRINLYLYTMTSKHVDVFLMPPVVSHTASTLTSVKVLEIHEATIDSPLMGSSH